MTEIARRPSIAGMYRSDFDVVVISGSVSAMGSRSGQELGSLSSSDYFFLAFVDFFFDEDEFLDAGVGAGVDV
jgi:hypothetical protein